MLVIRPEIQKDLQTLFGPDSLKYANNYSLIIYHQVWFVRFEPDKPLHRRHTTAEILPRRLPNRSESLTGTPSCH